MTHATTLHLESARPLCLDLRRRQTLVLPDGYGVQFTCDSGTLWLTLDHDLRDIVLEAGQSFTAAEHRRALVFALQESRLTLRPQPAQAAAPAAWPRWRAVPEPVPA